MRAAASRARQPASRALPIELDAAKIDAAKAYRSFLARARALPAADVMPYRLDIDLAFHNIKTGLGVVAAHAAEIPIHLPRIDLTELRTLAALTAAVKFAAMEVEQTPDEKNIPEIIAEARELRGVLMPAVRALAAAGLVSQQRFDAIQRGRGARDVAEDCVALANILREGGTALAGKHPIQPETIDRAAAVGTLLLQELRKPGTPRTSSSPAEVDIRNRMATLLVKHHERLQAVAFYFHGSQYEKHAPPLNSRQGRRAVAAPAPAPPAGDTTARS